jgi:hypothetical protein
MAEFAGAHAIDAAGGLAAAVRASYELEAAEKAKQIAGQVVKQVPAEARKRSIAGNLKNSTARAVLGVYFFHEGI